MRRRAIIAGAAACALVGCVGSSASDAGARDAPCEEEPVPQWIRYAGRIMIADNSIGIGYHGLVGGFRPTLGSALTSAGVGYAYVGPYSDAYGAHRSVSGISAYQQSSALQTDCETYDPRVVILGYAENDLGGAGGGQSRTPAQAIASMTSCIGWVRAGAPQAAIIVRTIVVPQNNGIPGYYARRDLFPEYNGLLPSLCASEGCQIADIGAPTTSDGQHPDDASTGYPAIGAILAAAVLSVLPGGA